MFPKEWSVYYYVEMWWWGLSRCHYPPHSNFCEASKKLTIVGHNLFKHLPERNFVGTSLTTCLIGSSSNMKRVSALNWQLAICRPTKVATKKKSYNFDGSRDNWDGEQGSEVPNLKCNRIPFEHWHSATEVNGALKKCNIWLEGRKRRAICVIVRNIAPTKGWNKHIPQRGTSARWCPKEVPMLFGTLFSCWHPVPPLFRCPCQNHSSSGIGHRG